MTTLHRIELTCPICGNHFGSQAVASTNSFGGKRTDFHERAAGMQPLPFLIHMCACCGYAGSKRDFDEGADVSLDIKERVWDELAPRLVAGGGGGALPGSEKYEAAARIAEWQGAEPRHVGDRVESEIVDPANQQWVANAGIQQRDRPHEWFG